MDTNVTLPVFGPSNPPCMVCHGKGSGLHYGVNTCQACKVNIGKHQQIISNICMFGKFKLLLVKL